MSAAPARSRAGTSPKGGARPSRGTGRTDPQWPETVTGRNPATGAITTTLPGASAADVEHAVGRARTALVAWSARPLAERCATLERFADVVDARRHELVRSIVDEVGKPVTEAAAEVDWTATSARWYATHPPGTNGQGARSCDGDPSGSWPRSRPGTSRC